MAVLPVVVYVEQDNLGCRPSDNPYKRALIYHLQTVCQVGVYSYNDDFDFIEDFRRTKYAYESGRLLATIVDEEESSDQHLVVIRAIRELSDTVPIIVIPNYWRDKIRGVVGYKRIYRSSSTEPRLPALINRWRRKLVLPLDYFGAESQADVHRLVHQLSHAYKTQYLDGNELGVPDENSRVVAQALRIRLCPAELLKQEFDCTLKREPTKLVAAEPSLFERELERVRAMCKNGIDQLWPLLNKARGYCRPGSQGEDVEGFAIDPLTLEYHRTSGVGCHKAARQLLEFRLEAIAKLRGKHQSRKGGQAIVSGIFFPKVEGIAVPIVQFDSCKVDGETARRIGRFLRQKRIAIPLLAIPLFLDRFDNFDLKVMGG